MRRIKSSMEMGEMKPIRKQLAKYYALDKYIFKI